MDISPMNRKKPAGISLKAMENLFLSRISVSFTRKRRLMAMTAGIRAMRSMVLSLKWGRRISRIRGPAMAPRVSENLCIPKAIPCFSAGSPSDRRASLGVVLMPFPILSMNLPATICMPDVAKG